MPQLISIAKNNYEQNVNWHKQEKKNTTEKKSRTQTNKHLYIFADLAFN